MERLHKRLRKARKELGYTQKEFAKVLGIGWQTLVRYEKGERDIPASVLERIIQMGIHPTWLLTGKGPMFSEDASDTSLQGLLGSVSDEELDDLLIALRIIRKIERRKHIHLSPQQRLKAARLLLELLDESDYQSKHLDVYKKGEKIVDLLAA